MVESTLKMSKRATTAVYIRIKRLAGPDKNQHMETYFILCDEYETIEGLKQRLLGVL